MVQKISDLGNTINQELNPGVQAKSSSLEILKNVAILLKTLHCQPKDFKFIIKGKDTTASLMCENSELKHSVQLALL